MPNYESRLSKLRKRIKTAKIDALIVFEPHNIFYLCGSNGGFTGARIGLIVDDDTSILIIDRRYLEEAIHTAVADKILAWTAPSYAELAKIAKRIKATKIGFESNYVTVRQYERLAKDFEGMQLVGVPGLVEPIREIKDTGEIQKITEAARLGDFAFDHILGFIKQGVTELDIAIELDFFMRKHGSEKPSFETIVASGIHSAVPHATPSNKKIESRDFVTLDFGAVVGGYHSDMTRTVVVGKATQKQKKIYGIVKEAQEKALSAVVSGTVCQDLDEIARNIISDAGYGKDFVHNLGHGVGLKVHEAPALGKGSETKLEANMVVTIEPGIYLNGFGGVRIEDLVVVTKSGCRLLSHSTKDLLEL